MARRITAVIILAVMLILLFSGIITADDFPSLFINDEAWYKDALLPMIERNGGYYVPIDIFSQFEYIEVSLPKEDNILIENLTTGKYISVLFTDGSAIENGSFIEAVGVFKDSGVYYIDVQTAADALGLGVDIFEYEQSVKVRIFDSEVIYSIEKLISSYENEIRNSQHRTETDQDPESSKPKKKIYFLCSLPDEPGSEFASLEILESFSMNYTLFLPPDFSLEELLKAQAMGTFGIDVTGIPADGTMEADKTIMDITKKKLRLLFCDEDMEFDNDFTYEGYIRIVPDIYVTGNSNAVNVFSEMMYLIDAKGFCVVYLDDCWNSGQIIRMVSRLTDPDYETVNLSH